MKGGSDEDDSDEAIKRWLEDDADDPEDETLAAVQRLLEASSQMFDQGKHKEAVDLVAQGIDTLAADAGESAPELVPMLEHMSLLQLLLGQVPDARAAAQRALAIAGQHYEEEEPGLAVCRLRLGVTEAVTKNVAEARKLLQQAYGVLQATLGEEYEGTGEALYYDTLAHLWQAQTAEAVEQLTPQFLTAVRMLAAVLPDRHPLLRLALLQHNRVILEGAMGGADVSTSKLLALYQQEVALHKEVHPTDRHIALLLSHVGLLQFARQGDLEAAMETFKQSEAIVKHNAETQPFPEDEIMLQEVGLQQALVAALQGDAATATPLLKQALEYFSQRYGPDSVNAAEAGYGVARLQLLDAMKQGGGSAAQARIDELRRCLDVMKGSSDEQDALANALLVEALENDVAELAASL